MISIDTQILKGKPVADAIRRRLTDEVEGLAKKNICLLYTSDAADE